MPSLGANFEEIRSRLKQGRGTTAASFEPIYYLVFPPKDILKVKRESAAWIAALTNDGWDVYPFSIAEHVSDILQHAKPRKLWLKGDAKKPLNWQAANQSLGNYLQRTGELQQRILAQLEQLEQNDSALLLITDVEGLHPYIRIGQFEDGVFGRFNTPSLILYPGTRTGKTRLKFLGFYNDDGNYRSVHVG